MAELLRVNGRDLSTYMNLQQDSGLDPVDSDRVDPQFSGALALGEGQGWVMDAVGNWEGVFPLVLKADTVDLLHQLYRDINADLGQGAQVEHRPDGATNSTFRDLERGRLEVQYQFFVHRKARARAVLRLWCRPYGHTATNRLLASSLATTSASGGPQMLTIPSVAGDTPALAEWYIRMGNNIVGAANRVAAFGIHPHASFVGVLKAASVPAEITATLAANIRGIGSQVRQYAVIPTSLGQSFSQVQLQPEVYYGRHRVLVALGHRIQPASAVKILLLYGAEHQTNATISVITPTAVYASGSLDLFDFGEITVPSVPSGQMQASTQLLTFHYSVPSGVAASAVATFPIQIGGVVLLPVDHSAGMVVGPANEAVSGGLGVRAQVRIQSWPDERVYKDVSSVAVQDFAARYRGDTPRLPLTPSGSLRAVVVGANVDDFHGTDEMVSGVSVRERFQFFR